MKVKCCNCVGEHYASFGGCKVQREAQRYIISHAVSYVVEPVRQIGGTTVWNDGASTATPVLSGPNVGAGSFLVSGAFSVPRKYQLLFSVKCGFQKF